ncbi:MAG: ABC transporter substrate-binding protein [Bacteroidetes bacterium]|nr:ABC transporter substrate-binding protein [Bacteroidota bacterium]
MNRIIPLLVATSTILCACGNNKKENNAAEQTVSLREEWFPNASYMGEVMAIHETDSSNGLNLKLIAGSDDVDPVKMVISGTNEFGVAGCERIFAAREKGADLVIIGVVNYINPTCFIARAEKNIKAPKDFEGKRVGVYPGNNTELVYKTLIRKTGVDVSKIKEVQPSFDLASFIADGYDVRPAYIFDETVSLDMKNIPYTIVKPEDYGIRFIGNVYFTTGAMIRKNPALVQAFINTIAQGWQHALRNPAKAAFYLHEFDATIDPKRELLSFQKGMSYFEGENRRILGVSADHWKEMADYLVALKTISKYDLKQTMDTSFIHNFYQRVNP